MRLETSKSARGILSIEGRPINIRTFDKLVDIGLLEIVAYADNGLRLFQSEDVELLSKRLPKKRLPSRHGLINYLQGDGSKEARARQATVAKRNAEALTEISRRALREVERKGIPGDQRSRGKGVKKP